MPNDNFSMESTITAEVTRMKASFATRSAMVLKVAEIMFDDWGVKPSANKVYEYIRQGSITDINKDLKLYWDQLRRRKGGEREIEGIPGSLMRDSGDLLRAMWSTALHHATKSFDEEKLSLNGVIEDLTKQAKMLDEALASASAESHEKTESLDRLSKQLEEQAKVIAALQESQKKAEEEIQALRLVREENQKAYARLEENSHESQRKLVAAHEQALEGMQRDLRSSQLEKDRAITRRDQIQTEAAEAKKLLDQTIAALQTTLATERASHIRIQNAWDTQSTNLEDRIQRLEREVKIAKEEAKKAKLGFNNYSQLTAITSFGPYKINTNGN